MICFAILMAAGFSKRFGSRNKLLAPFRGKPLALHTLDLVCGMGCFREVFFVCADEEVAAVARAAGFPAGPPVTVIHNREPEKGQGESVRLGTAAAARAVFSDEVYYLFFPCDQPLLDAATVRLLVNAARPGCIVEPRCPNSNSPRSPSLFSASFRDELLALQPGEQPRLIKSRHTQALITVEAANPVVLEDIDTPADLERLEKMCVEITQYC